MLIEKIPDIQKLTAEEKAALADELLAETGYADDHSAFCDEHVEILDSRWKHYMDHPETASTWEHVKERLTRS